MCACQEKNEIFSGARAYVKGKRAIKIKNSWNLNGILLFAGKKRDLGLGIPWAAGRFFIF